MAHRCNSVIFSTIGLLWGYSTATVTMMTEHWFVDVKVCMDVIKLSVQSVHTDLNCKWTPKSSSFAFFCELCCAARHSLLKFEHFTQYILSPLAHMCSAVARRFQRVTLSYLVLSVCKDLWITLDRASVCVGELAHTSDLGSDCCLIMLSTSTETVILIFPSLTS